MIPSTSTETDDDDWPAGVVCLFGWLVGVFTKELKWIVAVFVNSRYAKNKKQKNTKTVRHWKLCQHRQ